MNKPKYINPTLRRTIATVATDMFISRTESSVIDSMNKEAELVEQLRHDWEAKKYNLSRIVAEHISK